MSIIGKLVLYFLALKNSLGLLIMPGMSVASNISMASQAFSAFLTIICLIVWSICSTQPTDWWLYALLFSTMMPNLVWKFMNSFDLKYGLLLLGTLGQSKIAVDAFNALITDLDVSLLRILTTGNFDVISTSKNEWSSNMKRSNSNNVHRDKGISLANTGSLLFSFCVLLAYVIRFYRNFDILIYSSPKTESLVFNLVLSTPKWPSCSFSRISCLHCFGMIILVLLALYHPLFQVHLCNSNIQVNF